MPDTTRLYAGAYTSPDAQGLYPLTLTDGRLSLGDPATQIENASFAAVSHRLGLHYMVNETDDGRLGVWRYDNGWIKAADLSSGGGAPCFVALDTDDRALAVANYASGTVAVYWLDDSGLPDGAPDIRTNSGSGPDEERQDGPHAHCVRFHGGWLYSTDLGTDEVLGFACDPAARTLGDSFTAFRAPAGQGPRHIVFHPALPVAYLLTELGSEIFTLSVGGDGTLRETRRVSTRPDDFSGETLGGHIELNSTATRLYVTNRGHDSVATFAVAADGGLKLMQIAATGAESPRHFCLMEDRRQMVVAHQDGGCLTLMAVHEDGTLTAIGTPQPLAQAAFVTRINPIEP